MASIDGSLLDFQRLDRLAIGQTALHRLDPRAKVLVTLLFIICVVSFDRYQLTALIPFFLYPVTCIALADLPAGYLARKVALVLPFALLIGIVNPVFDRTVLLNLGPVPVSGGWLSCGSILLRASLTVAAALVLVAVTGFPAMCRAMESLGMPNAFAVQLIFVYRYIFILAEEGGRAARARELRCCGAKGAGLASYGPLIGTLLLRTWQRAERVHQAMLARGFTGSFPVRREQRFGLAELLFLAGWALLFLVLRCYNPVQSLGTAIIGALR